MRQGQGAVTTLVAGPMPPRSLAQVPGIRFLSPGINTRAQVVTHRRRTGTPRCREPARRWWTSARGRCSSASFFTDADVTRAAKVAVLGLVARISSSAPAPTRPGTIIRIKNQPFTVVAVLTSKGEAAMGQDQDDTVIVPYTTVQKRLLGVQHVTTITISAADGVYLGQLSRRGGGRAARTAPACSRARPTTSSCARSRRWPACSPRRPTP